MHEHKASPKPNDATEQELAVTSQIDHQQRLLRVECCWDKTQQVNDEVANVHTVHSPEADTLVSQESS